ncbi:polyhydroxyalkanoic acid system family protein [Zooshikella harenae]|uniref:Polyhydroxyalkanoic acid system family protein n=1 Tax=Zooshikella harenae TaxID=2827238 RepID=A0ABS5ZFL4_9GAMM|nr:polyhydroxyalkanoic acid system family protein [Zooshikella harenae]MBU2712852.1 polyhydroxyalkanoic acid system family protein [Zooshikella harenae]
MANIEIKRSHGMSIDKAKQVVQKIADEMQSSMGLSCQWDSDYHLSFKQTGVQGSIKVTEELVEIDVKLNAIMKAFRGTIEQQINQRLDKMIK